MLEVPQSFVVAVECEKAAQQNGYRRPLSGLPGWLSFASTTVPGIIYLGAAGKHGPWYLALDHGGVIDELGLAPANLEGPGLARFSFNHLSDLYTTLSRSYQLSASLPDAPLRVFEKKTSALPQNTEAERLVVQRIGQDIFRECLIDFWQGRCPLTGISDMALLRASHIVPWRNCENDAQRLDVHNGLLLSALWDAAFDRGLVTFSNEGAPVLSPAVSLAARQELRWNSKLNLSVRQRENLTWHRAHIFCSSASLDGQQSTKTSVK